MSRVLRTVYAVAGAGLIAASTLALAQKSPQEAPYPTRPIRMIVPFPPGGGNDIVARIFGQKLTEAWGQQIVVDNRPGAGGAIGAGIAAKAAPDGYTLLMANISTHAINPWIYGNLAYDPLRDFAPVSMVATGPYVLITPPNLGIASVKDLIALARSKPGRLHFASGGNGTGNHLTGELLKLRARIDIVHVPYKGSALGMNALIAGQVEILFVGLPPAMSHMAAGRVRALAVTGSKRSEAAPHLPTMTEAGVPDYAADAWFSFVAPAGTPARVIALLNRELMAITRSPEMRQKLQRMGLQALYSTPEGCREYMRNELEKWGQVVKAAGVRAQ